MDQTIYKKDSKDRLRFLRVYTEGDCLIQESGLDGTDSPVVHKSLSTPKNVGKSNETTAEEQAEIDGNNKVAAKLRSGYSKSIEAIEENTVFLPMLAKDYKKESHKVNWGRPVFVQPKFDGQRCIAIYMPGEGVTLWSRTGKEITTCKHIANQLYIGLKHMVKVRMVFDGELYSHEMTFQEIMKRVKKYRGKETERIMYYMYDIVDTDMSFAERSAKLHKMYVDFFQHFWQLTVASTQVITKEDELLTMHSRYLEDGYEGSIVRYGPEGYKMKSRSSNLLKYKDFIDEAYVILDVVPSEKRPEQGVVVCQVQTGQTFKANPKMSHAEREELLTNKHEYIGKTAEIRYFEHTDDGVPRFPVFVGVRNDK